MQWTSRWILGSCFNHSLYLLHSFVSGHRPLLTVPHVSEQLQKSIRLDAQNNLFFLCVASCSTTTAAPVLDHRWSPEENKRKVDQVDFCNKLLMVKSCCKHGVTIPLLFVPLHYTSKWASDSCSGLSQHRNLQDSNGWGDKSMPETLLLLIHPLSSQVLASSQKIWVIFF